MSVVEVGMEQTVESQLLVLLQDMSKEQHDKRGKFVDVGLKVLSGFASVTMIAAASAFFDMRDTLKETVITQKVIVEKLGDTTNKINLHLLKPQFSWDDFSSRIDPVQASIIRNTDGLHAATTLISRNTNSISDLRVDIAKITK